MLFELPWWRLSEAVARVIEATGVTQEEARIGICRAIAGRAIKIKCKLGKRVADEFGPGPALEGQDFHLPDQINPQDFDWENSRPKDPWPVRRERFRPPGLWYLEWIELFADDVTKALFSTQNRDRFAQRPLSRPLPDATGEGITQRPSPRSEAGYASPGNTAPKRRRGRRPEKTEQTTIAMRTDIQEGRLSVGELDKVTEEYLSCRYGVSRDVVRRARNAVLSEFRGR
jgi:hypothetical protein